MSILPVFGKNLRLLCDTKDSIASVSRDLGINRVQFNRFLKSESFPKPNVLQNICDYFGADARILTEPLLPEQLTTLRETGRLDLFEPFSVAAAEAMNYIEPGESLFRVNPNLPDGIYKYYRLSPSFAGKVNLNLNYIKTLKTCRVIRGYQHIQTSRQLGEPLAARQREFRGVVLNHLDGFSCIYFHAAPVSVVTSCFYAPSQHGAYSFTGLTMLHRAEHDSAPRVSRTFFQKVNPRDESVLALARACPICDLEDIPRYIADEISRAPG